MSGLWLLCVGFAGLWLLCVQDSLEASQEYGRQRDSRVKQLDAQLAASQQLAAEQLQQIRGFETERRQLHNTIQELKVCGYIRLRCSVVILCGFETERR